MNIVIIVEKTKVRTEKQLSTTVKETGLASVVMKIENVTSKTTEAVEKKTILMIGTRITEVAVQEIIDIMKKTSTILLIVIMEMAIETLDHVIDDEFISKFLN